MDRIEARLDGFDEQLREVEIAFGKLDQRLLTIRAGRPPRGERRQQLLRRPSFLALLKQVWVG